MIFGVYWLYISYGFPEYFTQRTYSTKWEVSSPVTIAVDSTNKVYVADPIDIKVYHADGEFIQKIGNNSSPWVIPSLAINSTNYLFYANYSDNSIWIFDPNGNFFSKWLMCGRTAIDVSGNVYITGYTGGPNAFVQVFTPQGLFIKQWDIDYNPEGIVVSPTGDVYLSYKVPYQVKKYDQNGHFIKNIETGVYCSGIAVDARGFLYVSKLNHGSITVYDVNGNVTETVGNYGTQKGQLKDPRGIAVNSQREIFVADNGNQRIQVFTPKVFSNANAITFLIASTIAPSIITVCVLLLEIRGDRIALKYQRIKDKVQQKWRENRKRDAEREAIRIQQNSSKVEQVILELAPQFSKLQVREIAERCGVPDESLIIKVLQQMIARKQIDATYFKSTLSVAFQQHAIEKPFPQEVSGVARQYMEVRRQYEYMGGKIRLKVKVVNTSKVGLLRIQCMLNIPDSFRLLRVEPSDYSAEGSAVKLQDLLPKEEKSVAFVLEPMICGKEQLSGTVSGVDAAGGPFAMSIAPLEVEVRCPLFATPEEANLPLVKKMALDLPVKSERVFYLPETLAPATAFELAKSAISERDVRFVGSVTGENRKGGDPFDESAWFYGTTKVEKRRYVLSAAVSEKDRVIRLATTCDDEAGCTGFLAETGAAVRRELVRRGAFESEKDVIELVCERCGATLPSAPMLDHDVRCPECQWSWRAKDFFR